MGYPWEGSRSSSPCHSGPHRARQRLNHHHSGAEACQPSSVRGTLGLACRASPRLPEPSARSAPGGRSAPRRSKSVPPAERPRPVPRAARDARCGRCSWRSHRCCWGNRRGTPPGTTQFRRRHGNPGHGLLRKRSTPTSSPCRGRNSSTAPAAPHGAASGPAPQCRQSPRPLASPCDLRSAERNAGCAGRVKWTRLGVTPL
mmetsp:Transcript_47507/g.75559  ORF Transcript_47507/g.75559 Transcript_47507/m.75559 type:complete len:201 (+) Transcript_47507:490-1092(+)